MAVMDYIREQASKRKPILVVLLDPEKPIDLPLMCEQIKQSEVDLVFVGGSTGQKIEDFVLYLKTHVPQKIVLFPGNIHQFCAQADALLFLSVLNATDWQMFIGQQIRAARAIQQSQIETIAMGYILIDGGKKSAVEQTTHCVPYSQQDVDLIVDTAIAGELLGMQLIYLEAGSGAMTPVGTEISRQVKAHLHIPLIVGGGIKTVQKMQEAFNAGADIVVIGNHFEHYPQQIPSFAKNKPKG